MDNKMKLFTHTDLDGIGCAILFKHMCAKLHSGLDIEYCGYDTINCTSRWKHVYKKLCC